MALNELIAEFLRERGALSVGFATVETLAGGPPSADITYKLEGARSAVSFALAMDRDAIRLFLSKKDRGPHERDNLETNLRSKDLSWELAELLKREGHAAKGIPANLNYRRDLPGWQLLMHPQLSHRYVAIRSGAASYGWSGNAGVKGHGTAIILGTTITTADLEPTEPVSRENAFCDDCKLCLSACAAEMVERDAETSVTIGGQTFTHGARKSYALCNMVCGGFTGLHRSGKWSTWSPGRFAIPDHKDDKKLMAEFFRAMALSGKRPPMPGGYLHPALGDQKTYMTCGNCQLVCFGDKKETASNVKLLHHSGCIIQRPNGGLVALPAEEAEREFERMDPEMKKLYC